MQIENNPSVLLEEKAGVSLERLEYLRKRKRRAIKVRIWQLSLLVALIGLWEVSTALGWADPFIVSSPSRIVATAFNLAASGDLWMHIGITLLETVLGFLLGTVLGVLIAIALWWTPTVRDICEPYLVVLNALPKIALGPVIIVWVGSGMLSIVLMALLISVVVTVIGVLAGFLDTDPEKLLLLKTFGATRRQLLIKVVLPGSLPNLVSALKINVGMSWVGVIVGEFLVSKAGLGYLAVYGGQVFKLDLVMTSVCILAILAALMYLGVAAFEKRILTKLT